MKSLGANQWADAREIMEWRSIPNIIVGPENSWSNRAERAGIGCFHSWLATGRCWTWSRISTHLGIAVRGGDLASLPVLKRMGVTAAVRASCYAYTLAEEIDQLIAAVQKNAEASYNG
jgi:selenocysteine lyase/cysteine desulfurase